MRTNATLVATFVRVRWRRQRLSTAAVRRRLLTAATTCACIRRGDHGSDKDAAAARLSKMHVSANRAASQHRHRLRRRRSVPLHRPRTGCPFVEFAAKIKVAFAAGAMAVAIKIQIEGDHSVNTQRGSWG
jgi:hypothetical protein